MDKFACWTNVTKCTMELKSNTQYIMHNIKDALTNSPNASGYLCVMKMKKKI